MKGWLDSLFLGLAFSLLLGGSGYYVYKVLPEQEELELNTWTAEYASTGSLVLKSTAEYAKPRLEYVYNKGTEALVVHFPEKLEAQGYELSVCPEVWDGICSVMERRSSTDSINKITINRANEPSKNAKGVYRLISGMLESDVVVVMLSYNDGKTEQWRYPMKSFKYLHEQHVQTLP